MVVVKIIELVGVSTTSWQNAVENAVKEASKTIRNISGVHVKSYTGKIKDSKIVEYRANVKVSFTVER
jgi:flavin-binding protein dodecin